MDSKPDNIKISLPEGQTTLAQELADVKAKEQSLSESKNGQTSEFRDDPVNGAVPPPPGPTHQGRYEFEEIPTFIERKPVSYQSQDKFIWGMRMNLYICFLIYVILANVIIFCGRWNLRNEALVDNLLGTKTSERRMEQMFFYNGFMLFSAAFLGVYSIMNHKYNLFLIYLLGLMLSFVFAITTFGCINSAANKMDLVLDNKTDNVNKLFSKEIELYDWNDITNERNHNINLIQTSFGCCGGDNRYFDWDSIRQKHHNLTIGTFPWSCCKQDMEDVLHAKPSFCGFQEVEKRPGCPAAFRHHLVTLRNNLSAQTKIMFQVIIIEALTIGLFVYKMVRGRKIVHYQPTPENIYSLTEE